MMEDILHNGTLTLKMHSDLTVNTAKPLVNKAKELLDSLQYHDVILDISAVNILDSTGITFIVGLYKSTRHLDKGFQVKGANPHIVKLFELMKLDEVFTIQGVE